jgi:LysR family nitrogen assimilation transcriptional regulator
MDLRSIRYFTRIADLGSITRAADNIGIAQPALSRHVRAIEAELGVQLLVRLPRGVRLTGSGRQFLERCRRVLREFDRVRDEVRADHQTLRGRAVIGLSPTISALLLPGSVERINRQLPQVTLKVVEGFSTMLYDGLLTGRVDVAVLTNPPPSRALNFTPLISEPIVVLTPPQHRGMRSFYTLAELSKTPVIVSERIRAIVEEQISRHGARLQVALEIDAIETIRRLLLRGMGPALMPVSTFHDDIATGRIAAFQIAEINVSRILVLARPAEHHGAPVVEEVAQILSAETNALFDSGIFAIPAPRADRKSIVRRTRGGTRDR